MNKQQNEQLNKAKSKIEKREFGAATDILLKLYDDVDESEVILLLGKTLFDDQKYVSASRLVDDNFTEFLQNDFSLLCDIYLQNHRYLQLGIIANGLDKNEKAKLLSEIKLSEKSYLEKEPTTIESNAREFMHLGAFDTNKQREVIGEAETLPLKQYLAGAQLNLLDGDVNPVWRMQLLNNLMRLGFSEKVGFIWIDKQKHEIIPKNATDVNQTEAYKIMQKDLEESVGQEDPIKAGQLQVIVNVDLQILFPYIDQTIKNPTKWLSEIRNRTFGDVSAADDDKDVLKWLSLIDSIMQTLIN
ncbi:hypothetical protein ACQW5G_00810 [Fructilactobacillus sp. Tb1]|uniref:hypothetical protein n=1 Tax=Fructilactobacillus sp. Tb1 TaxID=3422304 RepID=UPI003D265C5E